MVTHDPRARAYAPACCIWTRARSPAMSKVGRMKYLPLVLGGTAP